MANIRYMAARIMKLNYGKMFSTARAISKKAHRSFLGIFFDMIHCGMKFQAGYYDYQEFEFYLLNDKQRATFLTRGKNNSIIRRYNNKDYFPVFEDKAAFNKRFSEFIHRDWIDLRNAGEKETEEFFRNNSEVIAKVVDGAGGEGIDKYRTSDFPDIPSLCRHLKEKQQFLVEGFIHQHKELNRLYAGSVNTMRMFTFFKEGKGYFLQAILKIGNGGVVDNFSGGGMYTFPDEKGIVTVPAIDKADILHKTHPLTGTEITGFSVPMFEEAVKMVEKAAEVVPEVAYVGWDVAIGENGPELIEGNPFPGVFQKRASLSENKTGIIPLYRKYMDV